MRCHDCRIGMPNEAFAFLALADRPWTLEQSVKAQQTDEWCQSMRTRLGFQSARRKIDLFLYFVDRDTLRVLVPESLRTAAIRHFHDIAHLGEKRTMSTVRAQYAWPSLAADVTLHSKKVSTGRPRTVGDKSSHEAFVCRCR